MIVLLRQVADDREQACRATLTNHLADVIDYQIRFAGVVEITVNQIEPVGMSCLTSQ